MARLKVYEWEQLTWPQFRIPISLDEAKRIVKKLSRHFKITCPDVELGKLRTYAGWYHVGLFPEGSYIRLNKTNINLGTTCHEFAHHLSVWRYNEHGHGKTFKRTLKTVYTWAKRYLPET